LGPGIPVNRQTARHGCQTFASLLSNIKYFHLATVPPIQSHFSFNNPKAIIFVQIEINGRLDVDHDSSFDCLSISKILLASPTPFYVNNIPFAQNKCNIIYTMTHNWAEKAKPERYQWKKPEWNKAESIRPKKQSQNNYF
jgi:hypothetical protein